MIGNKREREVGSTIVNFNVTNIYAPSNITIQSGKEEKKKIEKETQLLEDIKKILLELEHGYHTDNKKNEVFMHYQIVIPAFYRDINISSAADTVSRQNKNYAE